MWGYGDSPAFSKTRFKVYIAENTSHSISNVARTLDHGHVRSSNIYSHTARDEKNCLNPLNRFLCAGSCAVHLVALGRPWHTG